MLRAACHNKQTSGGLSIQQKLCTTAEVASEMATSLRMEFACDIISVLLRFHPSHKFSMPLRESLCLQSRIMVQADTLNEVRIPDDGWYAFFWGDETIGAPTTTSHPSRCSDSSIPRCTAMQDPTVCG